MNDVPLVQKNDINSINTSLIAIKKQLKQLTEAVGLIDVPDMPDLSPFVKKADVVDVVESGNMNPVTSNAVVPVDEVTSGNMHSVTSNAVAGAFGEWQEVWRYDATSYILGVKNKLGTWLRIRFNGFVSGYIANSTILVSLPEEWRPVIDQVDRCVISVDTPTVRMNAGLDINRDGNIRIYFMGNTPISGGETVAGLYGDALVNIR